MVKAIAKRDAGQESSLFLRKRLHFCQAYLLLFCPFVFRQDFSILQQICNQEWVIMNQVLNKTDMEQLLPHTKIPILKSILCSIFAQKNNICPLHNFGHTDYIHITCVFLAICCKKHIASVHKKAKRSVAYLQSTPKCRKF